MTLIGLLTRIWLAGNILIIEVNGAKVLEV